MVLLFHIDQHLRSGLGLRQIIDWMMYVAAVSSDQWFRLREYLRRSGLEKLAIIMTEMCVKYFGLHTSFQLYDNTEADEKTCDDLMEFVLSKGNFGRKAGIEGKTAGFLLSTKSASGIFRRLQNGGLRSWKAVKKQDPPPLRLTL